MEKHRFKYKWTLKDAVFTKDKGKVFSCFACGGGSTMGYKLAGFDVIGCNEIDPKMMEAYRTNHNPKYSYLEPIQTFKLRNDLPQELYELDILDGSPPCSSFSMAGNREKDWGKDKVFREGQAMQVLVECGFVDEFEKIQPCDLMYYDLCKPGNSIASVHPKGHRFNSIKLHPEIVPNTIAAGSDIFHYEQKRKLTKLELCKIGSYPKDYNFVTNKPIYLIGMSVPPVMTANIATEIYNQWLSKL